MQVLREQIHSEDFNELRADSLKDPTWGFVLVWKPRSLCAELYYELKEEFK